MHTQMPRLVRMGAPEGLALKLRPSCLQAHAYASVSLLLSVSSGLAAPGLSSHVPPQNDRAQPQVQALTGAP